jgi:hypothetical protein
MSKLLLLFICIITLSSILHNVAALRQRSRISVPVAFLSPQTLQFKASGVTISYSMDKYKFGRAMITLTGGRLWISHFAQRFDQEKLDKVLAEYLGQTAYVAPGNIVVFDLRVSKKEDGVDNVVWTHKFAVKRPSGTTYIYIEVTFANGAPKNLAKFLPK